MNKVRVFEHLEESWKRKLNDVAQREDANQAILRIDNRQQSYSLRNQKPDGIFQRCIFGD
jgi:hypothetical protein